MQLRNATRQAYVRVHMRFATAQPHRLNLQSMVNCCVRLCVREKITGSKFDLLFEVDLAVPAVSVKLVLGSWFVLAVAMFY